MDYTASVLASMCNLESLAGLFLLFSARIYVTMCYLDENRETMYPPLISSAKHSRNLAPCSCSCCGRKKGVGEALSLYDIVCTHGGAIIREVPRQPMLMRRSGGSLKRKENAIEDK